MRRLIGCLTLWLVVGWISPGYAQPQGEVPLARLEISLWPEYDRPAMLVIYRAELAPGVPLPTTVALPIPAEVGEPYAVARTDASGNLLNAVYEREVDGEWALIAVETESPVVWIEFYQDLRIEGQQRSYTFNWPGGVEVASLGYVVQQPFDAAQIEALPAPDGQRVGEDGLVYLRKELDLTEARDELTISISYTKPTSALSVEFLQAVPPLGRPEATQGDTSDFSRLVPWIIVGVLAVMLVLGGFYLYQLRPERAPARRPRRRAKRAELDAATVFCHNCGTSAGISDRYCRSCGVQLRR